MKPEDQNATILKACGWTGPFQKEWLKDYLRDGDDLWDFCGTNPDGERAPTPDYLHDLNATHQMEKALTPMESLRYRETILWSVYWEGMEPEQVALAAPIDATAAQRCEAFLKVKGLWIKNEE